MRCWCTGRMVPRVLVHSVPAPRAPARGVPAHPCVPRVPVGARGFARQRVSEVPGAHTGLPNACIARLARLRPRVLVHCTGIGGLRCVVPACCCLLCNWRVRRTSPCALHGGGCVVALCEHVWHGCCSPYVCCTVPGVTQACVARRLLTLLPVLCAPHGSGCLVVHCTTAGGTQACAVPLARLQQRVTARCTCCSAAGVARLCIARLARVHCTCCTAAGSS